jgi:hypothetical protein
MVRKARRAAMAHVPRGGAIRRQDGGVQLITREQP